MKRLGNAALAIIFLLCLIWLIHNPEAQATYINHWNSTDYCMTTIKPLGTYKITGYDTCLKCCGKTDGITASGVHVTANRTIAMKGVAFGTRVLIAGLGEYVVEDRGVKNGVIDVYCVNHSECYRITGKYQTYIIERKETE